jgi:hypothetical protein
MLLFGLDGMAYNIGAWSRSVWERAHRILLPEEEIRKLIKA